MRIDDMTMYELNEVMLNWVRFNKAVTKASKLIGRKNVTFLSVTDVQRIENTLNSKLSCFPIDGKIHLS